VKNWIKENWCNVAIVVAVIIGVSVGVLQAWLWLKVAFKILSM
jgi:hypothetical protein